MCIQDDRPINADFVKRTPHSKSRRNNTTTTTASISNSTANNLHVSKSSCYPNVKINDTTSSQNSLSSRCVLVISGSICSFAVFIFSMYFPFMMTPYAASLTYQIAYWNYDPSLSFFDNTIWTYGTDYGLCIVMTLLAISILKCDHQYTNVSRKLRFRSAGLLLLYAVSVFAGGVAHQTYLTFESRQTISFRLLWTVCVGTVCAASGFMGCIGSEIARQYAKFGPIPVIPESFWIGFGIMTTLICLFGGFSYQRPACDIFIAGTTQFMSTFYVMLLLTFQFNSTTDPSCVFVRKEYRVIGFIGFILNAPLLPLYPVMVTYTDWSLALINTLLHTNLLTAWSMQGLSMKHLAVALATSKSKPILAVPVPATLQHHIPSTLHGKYHNKRS